MIQGIRQRFVTAAMLTAANAVLLATSDALWAQEASVESPALAVRPPRKTPSVPGLEKGKPQPVPGVGQLRRTYSPCLSADLKTIVFANWFERKTEYDLYIARRDNVGEPFGKAERIEGAVTPWTDAYPALSADGLKLVYISVDDLHLKVMPKLLRATRSDVKSPFEKAKELPLPGVDASRQRVTLPQFLNELQLKFCLIESAEVRSVRVASRPKANADFAKVEEVPLENPWPYWWVSADGLRAYASSEEGVSLAYRASPADEFSPMEVVLPAETIGKVDGPIWLAPQEDVIFYCAPGEKGRPDAGRHLMMIAF